jgi:hypothetical protein
MLGGQLRVFGAAAFGFDPAVGLRLGIVHEAILPRRLLGELRVAFAP